MKELKNIKYWLFDLDNTLYSGDTKVFDQVDKKMSKFISEKLKISEEEAKIIQKNYFHEYNTTLNGMIKNHDIDANEFLEFVHDVNLDFLKKDQFLGSQINKLNGKKIDYLPATSEDQFNIKPIYKTFPGWKTKTEGIRNLKDLPDNAKRYIHAIEDFIGARISSISTSPERDDTILVEDPFNN